MNRNMKIKIKTLHPRISSTAILYFLFIILAVLRAMQFHVETGDNMDLVRHFYMLNRIKNSGYSFFEFVFLHGDAVTTNITLRFCFTYNMIAYFAAKCFKNYYLLSWLCVFVDYSIIAYIGIDWWRLQDGRKRVFVIYEFMICFSLLPFFQAVSGLRTALAACVMGLGIYLYLYKNCKLSTLVTATLISATIHPAFLIAIPFIIIAKRFNRKKGIMIALAGSVSVSVVANIMIHSSNLFLYGIAFKYLEYTGESGYRATRFPYYGGIAICFLTLLLYFRFYMENSSSKYITNTVKDNNVFTAHKIYDFIAYYMIFILTNIGHYEMVVRPGYLLGALAPIITGLVFGKGKAKKIDLVAVIVLIMLFGILSYVTVKYMIWHSEFFVA